MPGLYESLSIVRLHIQIVFDILLVKIGQFELKKKLIRKVLRITQK